MKTTLAYTLCRPVHILNMYHLWKGVLLLRKTKVTQGIQPNDISIALRTVSRKVLPLYQRLSMNNAYAIRLVNALRSNRLNTILRVIRQVIPDATLAGIEASGARVIDLCFGVPSGITTFCNETKVVSTGRGITVNRLRVLASIVRPLLSRIIESSSFRLNLANAILSRNLTQLNRITRSVITTDTLIAVRLLSQEDFGFELRFRLRGVTYAFQFLTTTPIPTAK